MQHVGAFAERVYEEARNNIHRQWAEAKRTGKQEELIERWKTRLLLEVGTLAIGGGELRGASSIAKEIKAVDAVAEDARSVRRLTQTSEAEKLAAAKKAAEEAEALRIRNRLMELANEGHGPQRHEGQVTESQLTQRCVEGKDPMSGTTTDAVTNKEHRYSDTASKVNSEAAYAKADESIQNSPQFKAAEAKARANVAQTRLDNEALLAKTKSDNTTLITNAKGKGPEAIARAEAKARANIIEAEKKAAKALKNAGQMDEIKMPLEDIYGPDYKNAVSGRTRIVTDPEIAKNMVSQGARPEDLSAQTDFTDGEMVGRYRQEDGKPVMTTMFPDPR